MHPHITAGILERALHTSLGAETCLAARGSAPLQDELLRQARQALADHGADPRHPTDRQLLTTAAALRRLAPAPTTDPAALAHVLRRAAAWLDAHPYGPTRRHAHTDIVDAVERHTPDLRLRYDTLTVIAQHLPVPGLTITAWEWTANPGGGRGATTLLRSLAAAGRVPSYVPLPTEPVPDHYDTTIDLTDLDTADRAEGAPAICPPPRPGDYEGRPRDLVRAYLEAAAGTEHSHLARIYQDRADTLRTGL
ncbi:hypothetical protein ACFWA9_04555 [Kitasatospora sp. NPDC059973]|uniref:hypothetical protein n=1 Tax=Kitasatospora sp. NPDC059973 TaxID=3347020 RepID=UPI0036C5279E